MQERHNWWRSILVESLKSPTLYVEYDPRWRPLLSNTIFCFLVLFIITETLICFTPMYTSHNFHIWLVKAKSIKTGLTFSFKWWLSYLSEKWLVDLHSLVRALRQYLSPAVPAVTHWRVGISHAAQKHSPLIVELFLSFSYTLVHGHDRVIKVCERENKERAAIYE